MNHKVYVVNLVEYELGWGSKVFDTLYFKEELNAHKFILEHNSKNNLKMTPDYYTKAEFKGAIQNSDFKLEDTIVAVESNSEIIETLEFICDKSNYGQQILIFNNDEIDVILRNQNKNIRTHNSLDKKELKYKIIIERLI